MPSANQIICKVVAFRRFGAISCSDCEMMVLEHDWPGCRGMFRVIQLISIIHILELTSCYLASTTGLKYDCFEELEVFG
jgi:hypothetical protein